MCVYVCVCVCMRVCECVCVCVGVCMYVKYNRILMEIHKMNVITIGHMITHFR